MMDGKLTGKLSSLGTLSGKLSTIGGLHGTLSLGSGTAPPYEGPTEFTPTQGTQVVEAAGFQFSQNITINPIPSNYGLITWDGSVLTVS